MWICAVLKVEGLLPQQTFDRGGGAVADPGVELGDVL